MTTYATPTVTAVAPAPALRARRPARSKIGWNLAASAIIWITALIVVALWVSGGQVQALFAGGAETLNSAGRLLGLVAADLLLCQVLLMARVPVFERGLGRDTITRLHRLTGFWSFWLMLAHIALLVVGYAVAANVNIVVQAWDFVWNYPGMLLATAGSGLLVMVVVSSIRRARRRLRYESWHLLHLYAYLGVGLAIPHMLWTGADFLASPLATAYWWMLWAVSAAAIIFYRVLVPLTRSARLGLRVVSVESDGRRSVRVRVRGRRAARALPGQFFVWRFLDGPGWTRGHPFSLASAPHGKDLVISARVVGDGTDRLTRLRPGARVLVEGPYGVLTGQRRTTPRLLMLGAGAGVAPLISLLEGEPYAPGAATLVTRDHDERDTQCVAQIAALAHTRGLRHIPLNGPRSQGASSWIPASHAGWDGAALLRACADELGDTDVFVCGPPLWMRAVTADLRRAGVPADRIHTESFTY